MTWMNFCLLLAVAILSAAPIVSLVLTYKIQTRLLRIFSEKQGIPVPIMENEFKPLNVTPAPPERKKVSVPLPGASMFRKP
jgi:hypothetical protein